MASPLNASPPDDRDLDDRDVAAFLGAREGGGRIVRPGVPTATVDAAAAALGVAPERIVKSLVFLARGDDGAPRPWLVIAAGDARVRPPRLAAALGTSRRRVRLATPDEALAATGFVVGAMPPFGHRAPLPTLVDALTVPAAGPLYAGGGARDALLALDARELLALTGARRVDLTGA